MKKKTETKNIPSSGGSSFKRVLIFHFRKIQIIALIVVSLLLVGMWIGTDVYADVKSTIVEVLCLSCIKLQPKTNAAFTFNTVGNVPHPNFVLDELEKGPVFLEFSQDVCEACDTMHPTIEQLFNVSYEKEDMFSQTVHFNHANVTFIYINIDHTTQEKRAAQHIYDKDNITGLPMFTLITLGYDHGIIKPYYTSLYGILNLPTPEKRLTFLTETIEQTPWLFLQLL